MIVRVFVVFYCIFNLCFSSFYYSQEIAVDTKVDNVTLYHSGALVSRVGSVSLKSGVNELVFNNVSSKIVLNSLHIANKEITILNKSIVRKLTVEEKNQLEDKREALQKQISLIESKYNEAGFVSKVEDLEKMTLFYYEKMTFLKKEIRLVNHKIENAKKLDEIVLKNDQAAILKITVSLEKPFKDVLKCSYVCGGIGWSPAYDITIDNPSNRALKINYMAKAMSQTGEDWENINISLSSSFPLSSPTNLPKSNIPWVLGSRTIQNYSSSYSSSNSEGIKDLEGVEYDEINLPSYLKIRKLKGSYTLKSNSTVFTFPIESAILPAYFYYYGYPSIDSETYLVAQVINWDTLSYIDGIAIINYAGNNVGKSMVIFSESMDTLLLPVGKDNSIYMKRSEIADQKYFKINNFNKKKKITYAYQYELKNSNAFAIEYELRDQFPISQTKSAEVILDKTSNGSISYDIGEIFWKIKLKPGESIKKEFIYSIEMEANFDYYNGMVSKKVIQQSKNPRFL